jgi:hypothetical protein
MAIGDGPNKPFALRGVKDNPPYLHDERLLTLEDTGRPGFLLLISDFNSP